MEQLKKGCIIVRDVFKNPVVAFGAGTTLIMLVDTWFDVSTTDFVSAAANVAMAGLAYKALQVGRDYVGQMTTQEGYKKAIKFNSESFISLKNLMNTLPSIDLTTLYVAGIIEFESKTTLNTLKSINNSIKDVMVVLNEINPVLLSLKVELSIIQTYGCVLNPQKKEAFDTVVSSLNDLIKCFDKLLLLIDYTNSLYKVDKNEFEDERDRKIEFPYMDSIAKIFFLENINNVKNEFVNSELAMKSAFDAMEDYYSGSVNIKNYFIKEVV